MRRSHDRRSSVVEALESRTMLFGSDGPLVIAGTDGPDKIEVYYAQLAGGNWIYNYNVNGVGGGFYDFAASQVLRLRQGRGRHDRAVLTAVRARLDLRGRRQ